MIVKYEDLIAGCIYVTRGGLITLPDGVVTGWGYDRLKIIKKYNSLTSGRKILVQTPWGTEMELPEDYPLEKTSETRAKSEFKLVGRFLKRETIPFEEAVKRGICKEQDILPSSIEETETEEVSNNSRKPSSQVKLRKSATENEELYQKFIDYFSKPRKMVDAVKHFGIQYQKVRYTIMNIKKDGLNLSRFELKQGNEDGKTTFQLVKVEKK